ncbi:MAG: MOSC domain-containing protein [Myxococcaceae bacterium]
MSDPIATIEALYRYPVKSMAGEPLQRAELGWHGLAGDRRLALRKVDDRGGFPFLTAGKMPELVRFVPETSAGEPLPSHVRTPEGERFAIFDDGLPAEVKKRHGTSVQMMHFDRGIFDDALLSIIATTTVSEICRAAGCAEDVRRFRPNVVVKLEAPVAFQEDRWVGGRLRIGEAVVAVNTPDVRCAMLNIDPDTARLSPEMMKAAVRLNDNYAGVYCSVLRPGVLEVGQRVYFEPMSL